MREFAPSEHFFPAQRRRMFVQSIPALVVLAGVMGIQGSNGSFAQPGYWLGLLFGGVLIAFVIPSLLPGERQWRAFRIVVYPDAVQAMRRPGRHDVVIRADDLISVREAPGRTLVLRGPAPHQTIEVPAELENYAELRALIARWRNPEIVPRSSLRAALPWIGIVPVLGLFWGISVSPSLRLALISRWAIAIFLVGALWVSSRDRYMPQSQRVLLWLLMGIVVLVALAVRLVVPGPQIQ